MLPSTYDETFKNRVQTYIYAQTKYPDVMKNEFETAINMLELQQHQVFVNIPADNGFLKKYINNDTITYVPFETNELFHKYTSFKLCKLNDIPIPNNYVDRILSLASLHHYNEIDRINFYKEIKRILKKENGLFILADVIKNSPQDHFLNQFVHKYNSNGHQGIFFSPNDKILLEKNGFFVEIEYKKYSWNFNSIDEMCNYCKNLFGLDLIKNNKEILNGIQTYLNFFKNDNCTCYFDWQLIYFKCKISNP
jgi:SAM-dependent methyltransferase